LDLAKRGAIGLSCPIRTAICHFDDPSVPFGALRCPLVPFGALRCPSVPFDPFGPFGALRLPSLSFANLRCHALPFGALLLCPSIPLGALPVPFASLRLLSLIFGAIRFAAVHFRRFSQEKELSCFLGYRRTSKVEGHRRSFPTAYDSITE
jgi:hypothetical protein